MQIYINIVISVLFLRIIAIFDPEKLIWKKL